ncbi:MAG TPA: ATP-binding cassette domain-containing protein, partial [Acidimicrobiales bacterium]|nr:ATP-binding cassette domain-containing protein [Acidimicrobiales bacterium]
MLEARHVQVEVGGRVTLEDASFMVRAGDKVGLVGRNGAGKTSLLKVLGGETPPATGSVTVQGRLGFLTQDPRALRRVTDATGLNHVLSGRGLDEAAERLEKLRVAMEESPSDRAVARYSRAEEHFGALNGYAAESEVRQLAAGLGLTPGRVDLPLRVLSG